MKKKYMANEIFVALIIVVLSIIIGSKNAAFFSAGNVIDLLRSGMVMGIFSIGCMIVIVSGGIDVSFPAIAIFAMYSTTKALLAINYQGSILLAFLMAAGIGLGLGLINAVIISFFRLNTMIVTLGTSSMFSGFLLTFIGVKEIGNIPAGMNAFSKFNIITVKSHTGFVYGLPFAIVILIAVALLTWFILKYTMLGRGIYAIGGDLVAAERAGFNVRKIQFFVYCYAGLLAGIAGIIYTSLARDCNPVNLLGSEMLVIAAVVLGGTRISGGHGTVIGTILGISLVTIINNSLILLGIPSYWQKFVVGLMILLGTGVTSFQGKRAANNLNEVSQE